MTLWTQIVDVLREAMFVYAQVTHGNLAFGIMAVTFLARLALLPLMVRVSRRTAAHQEVMRRLQPELDALRAKFKANPSRLAEETQKVFAREGVSMVPLAGCLGALAQAPLLLALYSAVRQVASLGGRFLWIADISKPDMALAVLVGSLTGANMALGAQPEASAAHNRMVMVLIPTVITLITLWRMAAGVGVYWGVSSVFGIAQAVIVRRRGVTHAV